MISHLFRVLAVASAVVTLTFESAAIAAPKERFYRHGEMRDSMGMRGIYQMRFSIETLGLTPAQGNKMRATTRAIRAQRESIRNNPAFSPAQKIDKLRQSRATMEKKLNAILTPLQRKKREALIKQFRIERRKQEVRDAI